jgi:hypothetical protein
VLHRTFLLESRSGASLAAAVTQVNTGSDNDIDGDGDLAFALGSHGRVHTVRAS